MTTIKTDGAGRMTEVEASELAVPEVEAAVRQIYAAENDCPPEIRDALLEIEDAAGENLCAADRPCALSACYLEGSSRPWRLADDWTSAQYETAEDAADAAKSWYAD